MVLKVLAPKTVLYGTKITPSLVKDIIGSLPSEAGNLDELVENWSNESSLSSNVRWSPEIKHHGRYPSVSLVLGCTQSQRQLYFWQLRMIKQQGGVAAFRKYMNTRLTHGKNLHHCVNSILLDIRKNGTLTLSDDEIIKDLPQPVAGYVHSVLPFLRTLKGDRTMKMETAVCHHKLGYAGRFDALVPYRDSLHLIDWKSSTPGSSKQQCSDISSLYNDPIQVAAYIGALNSDPVFHDYPAVKLGSIVVANEDGSDCTVFDMDERTVEEYWRKWVICLSQFWTELEIRPVNRGVISFVENFD
ncbi:hypothetical protein AB6A40_007297 [Gnathostoma spinigerum]|uniref:Mitochondrial genome maintenance exonuclease 1 n=1 Tax=Gnathostoma spinigerum TaxID=75299 RepID=A0ABD6EKT3_9BILA